MKIEEARRIVCEVFSDAIGVREVKTIPYDDLMNDVLGGPGRDKPRKLAQPARRRPPTKTEDAILARFDKATSRTGGVLSLGFISRAVLFAKPVQYLKKSERQALFNLLGKGLLSYVKVWTTENPLSAVIDAPAHQVGWGDSSTYAIVARGSRIGDTFRIDPEARL